MGEIPLKVMNTILLLFTLLLILISLLTNASDDTPQSTSNNTDFNIQLSEPKNFKNLINDLYPM